MPITDRLIGPVVKASASGAADPDFDSCFHCGNFAGLSHTSDLKVGILVATMPSAWCYRVNSGTGWPSVNIL